MLSIILVYWNKSMQNSLNSNLNDEIDLRELLIAIWAYKLFIASTCVLGLIFGVYKALDANKEFKSTAIFKLNQTKIDSISVDGRSSAISNILGISNNSNSIILPTDRFMGRIFIEKIDTKLNFQADPYFNKYDPDAVDPAWKLLIKHIIGWQKSSVDIREATWQHIAGKYSESVVFDKTENGANKLVVTHTNAKRAAEIANVIMDEIISSLKKKNNLEQDQHLSYLSNTLAKALSDLEVSQSKLKEFALENSALPLESFAAGSLQLDALREQLSRTSKLHEAVAALSIILQSKITDHDSYLLLRQQFPIIDQVEFRRVLGQNEIISSWNWPEFSSVRAVLDTLTERKSRLKSLINASQIDAERSSLALAKYARLKREAKIAEATYTVLIEQVKAQSMATGYRPDKSEIYEYAAPSISSPTKERNLTVALWASLGLFGGATLSIIMALLRGVHYSKSSLIVGVQARVSYSIRALLSLRSKNLKDINTILLEKPNSILRDMAVEVHKSGATQVVVTSSRAKMTGYGAALALASYMQSESTKIAVINFSSKGSKLDIDMERTSFGSFITTESEGQITVLKPEGDLAAIEFLRQKDFFKDTQSLNSTFNLLFLCADNHDAISLLSALEGQKTFHITLARTKHTKSATLRQMRLLLPIQGLLYD